MEMIFISKKKYEKPELKSDQLFERTVLGCAKRTDDDDNGGCRGANHDS